MTTAARDSSDDPRWRDNRGPSGFWGGGGWGWCGRRPAGETLSPPPPWGAGHSFWVPYFIPKPVLIVLTLLGFMLWWPIGLLMLAVTLCRRSMFWGYRRWGSWQSTGFAPGTGWKGWVGGAPPSSGNHAFDEYRAETLRRLEEEQKEFAEFLERLRFAKDKAEFDQFMTERRNRPSGPSPEPPTEPSA